DCRPSTNPIPDRADTGFPAVPATSHGHAINCVPVHRFRVRRTSETGLTPAEWREFPRYALARILMHAVKTEPARFWRVFGWFVALFYRFPVRNALRASQAVHATDVMFNPSDRQVQKKAPKGFANNYFPEDLLGFNLSVFPGVFLLSRWRWSGCPVDSAIRFGPGLRAIMDILHRVKRKLYNCIYRQL
ncbi:hypothetical protein ACYBYB_27110, partial [Klebsiella pneumoniae]